jgi:hypothetical protein
MICAGCGKDEDCRFGFCFDCATAGEERAARRTVLQHLSRGFKNLSTGSNNARFDFQWAWERLTRTGDYAPDGAFTIILMVSSLTKGKH